MACSNTTLQRFIVRIEIAQGSLGPALDALGSGYYAFQSIVSVDGLTEGSQGTVSLLEQGKIFNIADGYRSIEPLKLQIREDFDTEGFLEQHFFEQWWSKSNEVLCNIYIDITDRKWCILNQYRFYGCSFRAKSKPNMVMGSPSIGTQDFEFLPYDVERLNAAEAIGAAFGIG